MVQMMGSSKFMLVTTPNDSTVLFTDVVFAAVKRTDIKGSLYRIAKPTAKPSYTVVWDGSTLTVTHRKSFKLTSI